MSSTLVTGIAELVTTDPQHPDGDATALGVIQDAAVVTDAGSVVWVGRADDAPDADTRRDIEGRAVIPSFVDSHSHLVFAGDRSAEFAARMSGTPYDGGGIAVSMVATREATDEQLRSLVAHRVAEMRAQGTGVVEIKSGYGLDVANEERALRIAREFTPETTFLGGHVVPPEFRDSATDRQQYVELVAGEMLTACAPYARWIDVFCEPNSEFAFTAAESEQILVAGRDAGLELRVHGNQLGHGPGVQLAVRLGAASVDHCTYLDDADIDALAESDTVATLLPGVEFSTRSPYPDLRRLIDAGVTVALASDCNPGTCYSSSIPFAIAVAVRDMGFTPAQALWSATAGAARSLRRDDIGTLKAGSRADLTVLDAPSYQHLAYRPGVPIARGLDL